MNIRKYSLDLAQIDICSDIHNPITNAMGKKFYKLLNFLSNREKDRINQQKHILFKYKNITFDAMRLKELATKYEVTLESLQNLIFDFDIDLNFCLTEKLEVSAEFEKFVKKHLNFIRKYAADKSQIKDIATIAKNTEMDYNKVAAFFVQNGVQEADLPNIRTNISSFQIHSLLGGDYNFLYDDLPDRKYQTNSLIGYSDLFFYQTDMLDPYLNEDQVRLWGISKSAGIILYGPPGSGKIYWGKRIADLLGYEFVHVFKDYMTTTTKNNSHQFGSFLRQKMNQPKTLLFIERFDELLEKEGAYNDSPEGVELINTILRHIQKDSDKEIVLVGSVEELSKLNEEITAPGRFDLHIPIFLPTSEERAQLIFYHLTHMLVPDSPLLQILKLNQADSPEFWVSIAGEMKLFSNTMVIDFTQSLKKRLYSMYRKNDQDEIRITLQLIVASLNEVKAKLTVEYLKKCHKFFVEAKQNVEMEFPRRFLEMQHELESFVPKEEPIRKIGFETASIKREQGELPTSTEEDR